MAVSSTLDTYTPALSIQLRNFANDDQGDWGDFFATAEAADRSGIDRIWVSDHVVFGEDLEAYGRAETGGSEGGKQPTGPDGHWPEPLTLLTAVGARTSHVRLTTGILLAALRRPVVLAKTLATMDAITNGRIDLGIGVGWQKEEYVAAGLDYHTRGKLLDHTIEVMQTLWSDTPAAHHSDHLDFDRIYCVPKPMQDGGVPVWVSGRINQRVLDRIVRFGAGWIPWGDDARDPRVGLATIREAMEAGGRGDDKLAVSGALPIVKNDDGSLDLGATMDGVPALVEGGITDFKAYMSIPSDPGEAEELFAGIVEAFRAAVGRS